MPIGLDLRKELEEAQGASRPLLEQVKLIMERVGAEVLMEFALSLLAALEAEEKFQRVEKGEEAPCSKCGTPDIHATLHGKGLCYNCCVARWPSTSSTWGCACAVLSSWRGTSWK